MNSSSCSKTNSPPQSAFCAKPRKRSSVVYSQSSMPGIDWPTEPRSPRTSLAPSKTRGSKRGKPLLQTPLQTHYRHLAHFSGEQYVQSIKMQCVVLIDRDSILPNRHPDACFRKACRSHCPVHPSGVQRHRKRARTCFEGPFAEVLRATGPMAKVNPIRWSTKYTDDETDLVMYPYRPYSPSMGRSLSHDPIEEKGGLNLYGFTGNSPTCLIDPDGRMTLREFAFALQQPPTKGPFTGYGGLTWFNAFEPKARVYRSIDGSCCWKVIVPGYADLYYWWVVIVPRAMQHEMLHVDVHRDTYNGFNGSASRFVGNCYSEPKAKCYQRIINGPLKVAWLASNHTKNLLIDQSYRSGEIAQAVQEEQSAWAKLAEEETKCEQIK